MPKKMDELELLYRIIEIKYPHQKGNLPNSPEWIACTYQFLQENKDLDPWCSRWEKSWAETEAYHHTTRSGLWGKSQATEILETGYQASVYPAPEIQITIMEAFDIYLLGQGNLSLETVFYGKPKKGVGNHAAEKASDSIYTTFFVYQYIHAAEHKDSSTCKPSLEVVAEDYFNWLESKVQAAGYSARTAPDIASFLKGYRRWKSRSDY